MMATMNNSQPRKKNKAAQALGRKGGKARVPKGFASPEVMAKALETRRTNREQKRLQKLSENA
jgi:hypothetical protein